MNEWELALLWGGLAAVVLLAWFLVFRPSRNPQRTIEVKMKWDITPMLKTGVYSPDELLRRISVLTDDMLHNGAEVTAKIWIDDNRWIEIERDAQNDGWRATAGNGILILEKPCTAGGLSFEDAIRGGLAYFGVKWTEAIEQALRD